MKRLRLLTILLCCLITTIITTAQQPFTTGNIVVCRVGDGSATLSSGILSKVFLEEYTPSGTLVQSIEMPSTGAQKITASGFNGYGYITLSSNGRYLVVPGFDANLGATTATDQRSVGLVDHNGVVSSITVLSNPNNSGITSAVSDNGTNLWLAGIGNPDVEYTTVGSSTTIDVFTNSSSARAITIADGQLYIAQQASGPGIRQVGTNLPVTTGQTAVLLPGMPANSIYRQFAFADLDASVPGMDVLYVGNQDATVGAITGLVKYSLVDGIWQSNGSIGTFADRYGGLTIKVSGNSVTVFASRAGTNNNTLNGTGGGQLVSITDNSGYNGAFSGTPTVLADISTRFAVNSAAFRGVALVPQGPSVKVSAKIFLQGAYNTTLSRHKDVNATWASVLNASALTQPFNTTAFGNYAGTESVTAGFFTSTAASTDISDWVLLELRDATTPATVIARTAAFVREDGQIVGTDGVSDPTFANTNDGNYFLVVRHRNHLGIRSAAPLALNSASATLYDFTTAQAQAFQDGAILTNAAMKNLSTGVFGMWGSNANSNTNVRFTGLSNDAGVILSALSNNQAAILSSVYHIADLNMDGTVRYTGLNNDPGALLSTLSNNQAAIITQHQ